MDNFHNVHDVRVYHKLKQFTKSAVFNKIISTILVVLIEIWSIFFVAHIGGHYWNKYEFFTLCGSPMAMPALFVITTGVGILLIAVFIGMTKLWSQTNSIKVENFQATLTRLMFACFIFQWIVSYFVCSGSYDLRNYIQANITEFNEEGRYNYYNSVIKAIKKELSFCQDYISLPTCFLSLESLEYFYLHNFLMIVCVIEILLMLCIWRVRILLRSVKKGDILANMDVN